MANVDGWIVFLLPPRRAWLILAEWTSRRNQDGRGLGRYRHHTCNQATTCNSNTLNSTCSSYLSPFTEHQGALDVKSQRLVPGSALQLSPMGCRAFERPKNNDHVEFVLAEQALGRERGFEGVDKEVSGAAEDDVDCEGRECVDRSFKSRWLSR